ncbi:unnamed protein product [Acanthosepion pharaonis]|uniref:Uncharacterized protein n=1 Tax=Acanthosepion pharaonis TaxID=158019 RepID=A0A812AUI0_ACAPH|nr:unnamed protein product [Sepia pharaonis]
MIEYCNTSSPPLHTLSDFFIYLSISDSFPPALFLFLSFFSLSLFFFLSLFLSFSLVRFLSLSLSLFFSDIQARAHTYARIKWAAFSLHSKHSKLMASCQVTNQQAFVVFIPKHLFHDAFSYTNSFLFSFHHNTPFLSDFLTHFYVALRSLHSFFLSFYLSFFLSYVPFQQCLFIFPYLPFFVSLPSFLSFFLPNHIPFPFNNSLFITISYSSFFFPNFFIPSPFPSFLHLFLYSILLPFSFINFFFFFTLFFLCSFPPFFFIYSTLSQFLLLSHFLLFLFLDIFFLSFSFFLSLFPYFLISFFFSFVFSPLSLLLSSYI